MIKDLCKELTIISGLAAGIDACAHASALKYKGKTISDVLKGIDL